MNSIKDSKDPSPQQPVVLDELDFYKLVSMFAQCNLEALQAERVVEAARTRQQALYLAMSQKYNFPPEAAYKFDEATHSLIPEGI